MTYYTVTPSPIGDLVLTSRGDKLSGVLMDARPDPGWKEDPSRLADAEAQLHEYFGGTRTTFDLELDPEGTPFQMRVWGELRRIPYGQTISYGELARRIGNPRAVRAVGRANGRNPIAVVVPCHRVIGADGTLTGYGGGLERKKILLGLERRELSRAESSFAVVAGRGA